MALNLQNAAQYIHGTSPSALDGLFQAVEAKCKELGLEPGRRDNVGVGAGGGGNVNVRGILTFVASVQPLPADLEEDAEAVADDAPKSDDTYDQLLAKKSRAEARAQAKSAHERHAEQTKVDHDTLRKLYGTLKAKFASAGYAPKATGGALT